MLVPVFQVALQHDAQVFNFGVHLERGSSAPHLVVVLSLAEQDAGRLRFVESGLRARAPFGDLLECSFDQPLESYFVLFCNQKRNIVGEGKQLNNAGFDTGLGSAAV